MNRLAGWRFETVVAVLALGAIASGVASGRMSDRLSALATGLALLLFLGRKWSPLGVSVASFVLLGVALSVSPNASGVQFFGLLAAFAISGAINSTRNGLIAWAVGTSLLTYGAFTAPGGGGIADALLSVAFASTMWGAGWLVSRRHQHAVAMESLAREVAEGNEERTRYALAAQRATIARELHDVVSHGLSVIVVQTLAAQGALEDARSPRTGEVSRHLLSVEASARDALGEMRRMLGLLQVDADGETEPQAPSPGLRHLPALIERGRSAGLDIEAHLADDVTLSTGLELSIYRVVQEALTNVVKHARGAHVEVRVTVGPDRVVVRVLDTGGSGRTTVPDGPGYGLIGMRERVAVYGGELQVGPVGPVGYEVCARLPRADSSVPQTVPRVVNRLGR